MPLKKKAYLTPDIKTSAPEGQPNRIVRKAREKIRSIELSELFEESTVGQEILATCGLKNIREILKFEDMLYSVAAMLGIVNQPLHDAGPALAFFLLVAQKDPDFVKGCLVDPDFDPSLASAIAKRMGWDVAELTAKTSEPVGLPQSTEKPKSLQETSKGLENPERLVEELEKTEVFRDDVINIVVLCDVIISMADQKNRENHGKPIDWDDVIFKMPDYSAKGLMAFLKKRGITVKPPASISLEDVFSNPKSLGMAINRLEWDHDNVDPRHFGAFVLMAAERNPKLVFDYFSDGRYAEIRDPEAKKAVMQLLIEKGYPATQEMFEAPEETS